MSEKSLLIKVKNFAVGDWVWCLHCQRVYKAEEFKLDRSGDQTCPYPDCDGTFLDGTEWDFCKRINNYPEVPQRGVVYALYPKKK